MLPRVDSHHEVCLGRKFLCPAIYTRDLCFQDAWHQYLGEGPLTAQGQERSPLLEDGGQG